MLQSSAIGIRLGSQPNSLHAPLATSIIECRCPGVGRGFPRVEDSEARTTRDRTREWDRSAELRVILNQSPGVGGGKSTITWQDVHRRGDPRGGRKILSVFGGFYDVAVNIRGISNGSRRMRPDAESMFPSDSDASRRRVQTFAFSFVYPELPAIGNESELAWQGSLNI